MDEKIQFTRQEIDRICEVFKNEEFRNLFFDYCSELSDPEKWKQFREEIIAIEKQRGFHVKFLDPEPGYVITTFNETYKVFINICSNHLIDDCQFVPAHESANGVPYWSIPRSLTSAMSDYDSDKQPCLVYDVVVNLKTLQLAEKDPMFRKILNEIAVDSISTDFKVQLKKDKLEFPKIRYKGLKRPTIIRERIRTNKATEPNYKIKYRSDVDLKDFTNNNRMFVDTRTIPKQLLIEIDLPGLQSKNQFVLDVKEQWLELTSESPVKYRLSLKLPYKVSVDDSNTAQFFCNKQQLVVTLNVLKKYFMQLIDYTKPNEDPVEYTNKQNGDNNNEELKEHKEVTNEYLKKVTCEQQRLYLMPKNLIINIHESCLEIKVMLKNIDKDSISYYITSNWFRVSFSTLSRSFFVQDYEFYCQSPDHDFTGSLSYKIESNFLCIQMEPFHGKYVEVNNGRSAPSGSNARAVRTSNHGITILNKDDYKNANDKVIKVSVQNPKNVKNGSEIKTKGIFNKSILKYSSKISGNRNQNVRNKNVHFDRYIEEVYYCEKKCTAKSIVLISFKQI